MIDPGMAYWKANASGENEAQLMKGFHEARGNNG